MSQLRITQVKSKIGGTKPQRASLRTLGLGRISNTTVRDDGPWLQGLLRAVAHLVVVEPVSPGARSQSSEEASA